MLLKFALLLSMLIQLGATILAVSLIRRTRYNIAWILISAGFVLMAVRRLFEFSTLFWESQLFDRESVNTWLGILISVLVFIGVIFIRQIFNLQDQIDQLRQESEKRVLSAVIQGEEKARANFARELHDGLGPILSSVKMTMSAVDPNQLDGQNRTFVERSCMLADEAVVSLREISDHLSPHLLKNYGLVKAVKTVAAQLFQTSKIDCQVNSNIGSKRYPDTIEISLYRITSELMNNTVKHANASKVEISLQHTDQFFQLRYRDNGKGADEKSISIERSQNGMGLENIRSRVKMLNGYLLIETSPGNGFFANILIPVS